jgi:5-formyltetrahydrofolate cyclo-ligase
VGDEIDPLPLLQRLRAAGAIVALPVVVAKDQPLEFRRWPLTKKPPPGAHGIPAPGPDAPLAVPEILLVPLLAFDGLRRRLGSGLGYYDRTLARLRAGAKVLAVGFAFAAQRDESLPHGPDDQVLDWVVTETEVFSNMKERNG